ncbi:MAG: cobyrinic acid a,c-diamide synthase [Myxococcales bacterium]|nr:cobyrinic acid a,c-diamide synthase [Myxococcales bacterium]
MTVIPRLVVAGAGSGVGKTTVTVGLCRALRARGLTVAVFKCGPDYLDPTYHQRGAGRPSHNLDGWMMGRAAATATFVRACAGADIAIIEGMMGLFDGASPTADVGSTAEMAKWLNAPVLLVVDASGVARSIAALVGGFAAFDRDLTVGGVICNHVGGRGHVQLLRQAQQSPPILGGLTRQGRLAFPERHLGLRSADRAAVPEVVIDGWGRQVAEEIDLDAVLALARSAPPLPAMEVAPTPTRVSAAGRCRIGVALDDAFHFYYEDNLRRLETLGAELVRFSPLGDARLPDVDGLYIGGGYPEVHAAALAGNRSMREDIARFAGAGKPVYAECGGLMYLAGAVRGLDGQVHAMVGVLPGTAVMSDRLEAIGYVEVETQRPSLLGPPGLRFRGHQFRYSRLEGAESVSGAYTIQRPGVVVAVTEGYRAGSVLGSYVHAHWASNPRVAEGFVAGCTAARSAV